MPMPFVRVLGDLYSITAMEVHTNVLKTHGKKTSVERGYLYIRKERRFTKEREGKRKKHIECP